MRYVYTPDTFVFCDEGQWAQEAVESKNRLLLAKQNFRTNLLY
jgi:hypothetical protein